jgi:hypothetical protein
MTRSVIEIPDPREFPAAESAGPAAAAVYALAAASLEAATGPRAEALDHELRAALARRLAGKGALLAALFAGAPSVAVARALWRQLDAAWRDAAREEGAGLAVTVFAVPLLIVTGLEGASGERTLPGVLSAPERLVGILQEHGAVAGNRSFALANALVGAEAIAVARLPEIFAWQRLPDSLAQGAALPARVLAPAPLSLVAGRERVHLRFLVGSALAKPGVDLFADSAVGHWGVPLTRELYRQLGAVDVPVLALPRAPQRLLPAALSGRTGQREIGAQLFASNAIRKLRATVGEPTAVISAHRAADAPNGGELRVSLSSAFDLREAEGFRCPLEAQDRVGDVAAMLTRLLRDCRVSDVRIVAGVHPDRDPATGLPLLFKADMLPARTPLVVH